MSPLPTETEVVVVGSGVSGLGAAVTLAEGGAKVIVFEKERSLGGTSNFFHGIYAVESEMQRERYITYTRDEAFKGIMEYSHWRANPRLVRAIVNQSGGTISWLQKQGVVFIDATINMPDVPRVYHVVKGKGEAVVKALVTRAKELGAHIYPGTPVKRLLKSAQGITGVVVEENEEEVQVKARVVVIASGGFANNKEWIKKYAGYDLDTQVIPVGNVDKTGDGIRMSFEAGADSEGISLLELFRVGPVGMGFAMGNAIEHAAIQPDLWVDARGERFCDEAVAFYDSFVGHVNVKHREGYTFSIFDSSIVRQIAGLGIVKSLGVDLPPGTRFPDLEKEIKAALDNKSPEVFDGNSIEDLAVKIGAKPETLKATLEEYNGYCAKGHDDLFAKDQRYLREIKGPRYFAVRAKTVFLGTMGGIKISHRAEAVDKKGQAIPGLYAAGFDAGGMYGDSYCIRVASGLAAGFAVNSGRLAGKNALKYLGK